MGREGKEEDRKMEEDSERRSRKGKRTASGPEKIYTHRHTHTHTHTHLRIQVKEEKEEKRELK
jgi:hypothetical protein